MKMRLVRLFEQARIARYAALSTCKRVEGQPYRGQPVLFGGAGRIVIGSDVFFGIRTSPGYYSTYAYLEARAQDAVIEIGDGVLFNNGPTLISDGAGIRIGQRSLIGVSVEISDTDYHDIRPCLRRRGTPSIAPVEVGQNVFIGSGVRVLKGVTIGDDSVIGAGAVVASSVPARTIAA